jgi:ubiquinone/menaquinone biosynthesis C-methylase UbiE
MKKFKEQDRKKEKIYWDSKSKKERNWISNTSIKDIKKKIINSEEHWWEGLIGKIEDKKILDIGCGNTYFITYWQLTGNEAFGSDFSPETIKNNQILHKKLGLKSNFYVSSSEKIQARNNSFDIIHMGWVIHHIPQELQDSSIQEMRRVLKKGGKLIVFETNYAYPPRWIVQIPVLKKLNFLRKYAIKIKWLDPEEKALTNRGYLNLIKRNGFKIEKVSHSKGVLSYPLYVLTRNRNLKELVSKVDKLLSRIIPDFFKQDIMIIARK